MQTNRDPEVDPCFLSNRDPETEGTGRRYHATLNDTRRPETTENTYRAYLITPPFEVQEAWRCHMLETLAVGLVLPKVADRTNRRPRSYMIFKTEGAEKGLIHLRYPEDFGGEGEIVKNWSNQNPVEATVPRNGVIGDAELTPVSRWRWTLKAVSKRRRRIRFDLTVDMSGANGRSASFPRRRYFFIIAYLSYQIV